MKKLDRIDPQRLATNPRATLQSWLKYRDVVISAMRLHPKPFFYKPVSMSASSVASKMRDAIRGKLAFNYPDADLDSVNLARWYAEIIIKHDKETVYIGPPEAIQGTLIGSIPSSSTELNFPTLTFEELSAFTLLLSSGRINGPVKVIQPPDISLLTKRPNVEILTQPDGSLVIL